MHLEAGLDCVWGGVAGILQRGLPRDREGKAIYSLGNSRTDLSPSGFMSGSSGPV